MKKESFDKFTKQNREQHDRFIKELDKVEEELHKMESGIRELQKAEREFIELQKAERELIELQKTKRATKSRIFSVIAPYCACALWVCAIIYMIQSQ